jgi:1-acyl-sn-glycerol-3-phosphate acyltransferase
MPFIGTFLRKGGHLSFDRNNAQSRLRQTLEMEGYLRQGEAIFIFPEGTFTSEEGLRLFQLGAFKASIDTGVPIIPVSIAGARKVLRDGSYLPRHSSITITLSPPIYPRPEQNAEADWQEVIRLRDTTREVIGRHIGEPVL